MAFEEALRKTQLLARQAELLEYFLDDMSHGAIAAKTGMRLQSVRRSKARIISKIAYQYER